MQFLCTVSHTSYTIIFANKLFPPIVKCLKNPEKINPDFTFVKKNSILFQCNFYVLSLTQGIQLYSSAIASRSIALALMNPNYSKHCTKHHSHLNHCQFPPKQVVSSKGKKIFKGFLCWQYTNPTTDLRNTFPLSFESKGIRLYC